MDVPHPAPAPGLSLTATGRVAVVTLAGELDLASAPELRESLLDACGSGARLVVVDLAGVSFADSAALGVLAAAALRCRTAEQQFQLVHGRGQVRRALEVIGLGPFCAFEAEPLADVLPGQRAVEDVPPAPPGDDYWFDDL